MAIMTAQQWFDRATDASDHVSSRALSRALHDPTDSPKHFYFEGVVGAAAAVAVVEAVGLGRSPSSVLLTCCSLILECFVVEVASMVVEQLGS